MGDYREVLTGTIVGRGGAPVAGARVQVFDKDLLSSDHLGTTTTDEAGRFRVTFGWGDYKDSFFEDRPDIFLKVTRRGGSSVRTQVFRELRGEMVDDETEVMDLGAVEID